MTTTSTPTLEIITSKRDDILRMLREHHASHPSVFGSVARGEADEDSDIDFLMHFNGQVSSLGIMKIEEALEEILGFSVDVVADSSLTPEFEHVLDEAISV